MVFKQLHQLDVQDEEFIPFGGQGEDRFLGGMAEKYNVQVFAGTLLPHAYLFYYCHPLSLSTVLLPFTPCLPVTLCYELDRGILCSDQVCPTQ